MYIWFKPACLRQIGIKGIFMLNRKPNIKTFLFANRYVYLSALLIILMTCFWFSLPSPLFTDPYSLVIYDKDGNLLGAKIADDGQWRFPYNPAIGGVPEKFKKTITTFEDKRFYYHLGVDPFALTRALIQNIKMGKKVSGGSTITMQVIRLSRNGKPRTIWEKIVEMYLAVRLELSYSKEEILALYASYAPFGGNAVGLESASWRYFSRNPSQLSWAETCLLSVLPNSPALIHPGKNRSGLLKKRNKLLKKLYDKKIIDSLTYQLSVLEPIPEKPSPLPQFTPHLLQRIYLENFNVQKNPSKIITTIDINIQKQTNEIVLRHNKQLKENGINNACAIVVEVETGNVLSYIGNINDFVDGKNQNYVDIITAPRSTGSILKPFLYAGMLTSGEILPNALVPDIPTQIGGYFPQNYNLGYDGAIPAKRALARSLNVPAVRMLQNYGVERFHYLLKKLGMTTINQPSGYYGLSLILGGAEGKLWDLVGIYASMARTLNHFSKYNGKYDKQDYFQPKYILKSKNPKSEIRNPKLILEDNSYFSAGAIWLTFNAMLDVERPEGESGWEEFSSSKKIAWKTGTSFGFRDGWAIGITPDYVVGIWVGNADGEGRPLLTGISTAAPILFDIFSILPSKNSWFDPPYDDIVYISVCKESGYRAGENCPADKIDSIWVPVSGLNFPACPYHQIIHLDATGQWRVHSDCEAPENMQHETWFILPPAIEWYYKTRNFSYKTLPPFRDDCKKNDLSYVNVPSMQIIYPKNLTKIYVPIEIDGSEGNAVFEVAHRKPNTIIFWHIDDEYIGQTKGFHKMAIKKIKGTHVLTLVDENGERLVRQFEIIDKEK